MTKPTSLAATALSALLTACAGSGLLTSPSVSGTAQRGATESPSFKERFAFNGKDGANPESGLIYMNGALYGTTTQGGKGIYGTVFKMPLSGSLSVIHNFYFGRGSYPAARLTNVSGTLYGTTVQGGASNHTESCSRLLHPVARLFSTVLREAPTATVRLRA